MKIGTLTYHFIPNYGAILQAYALWKFLKSQGYDAEIIDYRLPVLVKFYLRELYLIRKSQFNPYFLSSLVRAWKIRRFIADKAKLSPSKTHLQDEVKDKFGKAYDVVICGSDEIWKFKGLQGYDPSYFLDFVDETKTGKISYAATFGNTGSLDNRQEEISHLINRFHNISVRDSNSLRLIAEECGRKAEKVLDPTFLVSYEDVLLPPSIQEKYLLIYNDNPLTPAQEQFIKVIARAKGLRIISIGYFNQIAERNFLGLGPQEWLGYFQNASYTITNFFHGTVFSIIFRRSFSVLVNKYKTAKVSDLLGFFGLEERILYDDTELEIGDKHPFDIDYSLIEEKIEIGLSKSKAFLLKAIEDKE